MPLQMRQSCDLGFLSDEMQESPPVAFLEAHMNKRVCFGSEDKSQAVKVESLVRLAAGSVVMYP